jgi:catechol 2,3-dioxygenase-like lactoylglutathione lyase family enzyme
MIKELSNIGLKVTDLDREVAFLREVGASLVMRERVSMVGEEREYAILMLGGVRMVLFETVVFENLISGGVRPGLTHAVFEVDELEAEYARISALGAEVLVKPTEVSGAFGRRRLAFFRSPGGFVFEVMQVLERKKKSPLPQRKPF